VLAVVCASAVVAAGLSGVSGVVTAPAAAAATLAPLPVGPRPNATRLDFAVGPRVTASVDVGTGNLLVTTTDLTLPGVQSDLRLGLDFNSLNLGATSPLPAGAAGKGFAMRVGQDTRLVVNADGTILYLAPDGQQGLYRPVTGTSNYTSPVGFKSSLVKTGTTGWTLSEHATRTVSTFNTAGTLTKVTDRNGQPTTLAYSPTTGKLDSITATRGGTSARRATMTFTGGLLTAMTQASDTGGSRTVAYGYDTAAQRLTSITDPAGGVTTLTWDPATGDLASVQDPSTTVLSFGYDTAHRVTSVAKGSATGTQAVTRLAYPSTTQTLVAGPNTDQAQPVTAVPRTTYTLDGTDRVTQAVDELGRVRKASYTTAHADLASTTSAGGGVTTNTWTANAGESLTKTTSATGTTASLSYTSTAVNPYAPTGGVDGQGNGYTIGYDGAGNPVSSTNNAAAATAKVTFRGPVGSPQAGTLATSTDPAGNTTTYSVDPATNQITGITPPAAATGLGATTLGWDGYGRLKTVTDGRGITTTYGYTDLDQLATIRYSDGTAGIDYTYNDSGLVRTRTDGTGTTTYTYNARDELIGRAATSGGGAKDFDYDLAGNLTAVTTTRGTTSYTYDEANQLATMTPPGAATTRFGYNADGLRADTWWKANAAKTSFAAHTHTDYDTAGRIARTWTSRASDDTLRVFDTSYCYVTVAAGQPCPASTPTTSPAKGLLQWSHDNLTGVRATYGYDKANRLTAATNHGGHSYTYRYDANGNRTTVTVDGATTQTLAVRTADNQVTTTGYGYDRAGNTTTSPTVGTLAYNGAGQLTGRTGTGATTSYAYAGPGQNELVTRTTAGGDTTSYVYGRDGKHGVPMIDAMTVNGATHWFDNDPDGTPLAMELPTGKNGYFVLDAQGSVVALVDGAGDAAATYAYDPYGTVTASTGTGALADANPYRHTTGLYDPATGLVKHGTRWNDTTTGRWTTVDPITRLVDPNQANPYAYADCSPVTYLDPRGLFSWADFGQFAGLLADCAATGVAASELLGLAGATVGPEGLVIGAGIGLVAGCGAGIIVGAKLGFNPFS
jgi:RHS repeat-associated protein